RSFFRTLSGDGLGGFDTHCEGTGEGPSSTGGATARTAPCARDWVMTELTAYGIAMFCATALVICVTPGPDMVYVVANGIQGGVRAGLVAAVGMATGMLVHTMFAVTGLSLFLSSSESAFDLVKLLGASYLLFIAVQTLKSRKESLNLDDSEGLPLSKTFQRAVVTNV